MARVLVTDASRGSAIAVIRSLGRAGHTVVAADTSARSAGFRSRYTAASVVVPDGGVDPAGLVDAVDAAVVEHGLDLVVPVTDAVVLPLDAARDRFAARCALALPPTDALRAAADKEATLALAARLGVPAPETVHVRTAAEAREAVATTGWPVVLKPRASRHVGAGGTSDHWTVTYAADDIELRERMAPFEAAGVPVLLQRLVTGEGHGVEVLAHDGHLLAAFQHRRLREVPVSGGASAFRESVAVDPTLLRHTAALLRELRWSGLAMVEFKLGDDGPRLMEINGRIWGSLPLAVRAGMDFPRRLADLLLDGPPRGDVPVDTSYALGVRSRNLSLEVVWIGAVLRGRSRHRHAPMPPRRAALRALARLPFPGDGYDVQSMDDPRPGVADLAAIVTKLRGKVAS